ncbi:MAG: YabP/YqfC family sporulation protein [Oscillospiraceae bacterium]|nr:YabP/YqfC family sporulation protein [Oscillospiraceae bacterium]
MFYLEMENEKQIYLSGCTEINKFNEDCITLASDECILSVSGSNLCATSYANGEIYINGDILRIEFGEK